MSCPLVHTEEVLGHCPTGPCLCPECLLVDPYLLLPLYSSVFPNSPAPFFFSPSTPPSALLLDASNLDPHPMYAWVPILDILLLHLNAQYDHRKTPLVQTPIGPYEENITTPDETRPLSP